MIIKINGLKIGIIGLGVNPEGLISESNFIGIKYNEPIEIAERTAEMLKNQKKCNFVVCLSHLGYEQTIGIPSDIELSKKTKNIDIIIGGHTHTMLEKSVYVINSIGKKVMIVQCGSMGVNIGRIDLVF